MGMQGEGMRISGYMGDRIFDLGFRGFSYSKINNLYAALFTTLPARDNDSAAVEPSGGGYARATILAVESQSGTIQPRFSGAVFPLPTASWGSIIGYGIYDAASGGNLLCWAAFTAANTIASGDDQPSLAPGAFIEDYSSVSPPSYIGVGEWRGAYFPNYYTYSMSSVAFSQLFYGQTPSGSTPLPTHIYLKPNIYGVNLNAGRRMPTGDLAVGPLNWYTTQDTIETGPSTGGRLWIKNAATIVFPDIVSAIFQPGTAYCDSWDVYTHPVPQSDAEYLDPAITTHALFGSSAQSQVTTLPQFFYAGSTPRIKAGGFHWRHSGTDWGHT